MLQATYRCCNYYVCDSQLKHNSAFKALKCISFNRSSATIACLSTSKIIFSHEQCHIFLYVSFASVALTYFNARGKDDIFSWRKSVGA